MLMLDASRCDYCEGCVGTCPVDALDVAPGRWRLNSARCIRCDWCIVLCPSNAIAASLPMAMCAAGTEHGRL